MSITRIFHPLRTNNAEVYIRLIDELTKDELETHSFGETVLAIAAENGLVDALRLLHKKGVDLNKRDKKTGLAPIHAILYIQDAKIRHDCLNFLIEAKVDLNQHIDDAVRMSPLHLCVKLANQTSNIETFLRLMYAGCVNVNPMDSRQETPLDYAMSTNGKTLPYLVQVGAQHGLSAKSIEFSKRNIASTYAPDLAFRSMINSVGLISDEEYQRCQHDPNSTHIHLGTVDSVEELQRRVAHVLKPAAASSAMDSESEKPQSNETPFHLAIKDENKDTALEWCNQLPMPLIRDGSGNFVYHTAALHGRKDVLERLFTEHKFLGFQLYPFLYEQKNLDGNTCLHLAINGCYVDTVVFILNQNCRVDIPNNNGLTAIALLQSMPELFNQVKAAKLTEGAAKALGVPFVKDEISLKRSRDVMQFKPAPESLTSIQKYVTDVMDEKTTVETAARIITNQKLDVLTAARDWLTGFTGEARIKIQPLLDSINAKIEKQNKDEVFLKGSRDVLLFKPAPANLAGIQGFVMNVINGKTKVETAAKIITSQKLDVITAARDWLSSFEGDARAKVEPLLKCIIETIAERNQTKKLTR